MTMRKTIHASLVIAVVAAASFILAGCPMQPSYPSTITPIYAATSANGLWVYNGSSWTNYTNANTGSGLASTALTGVAVLGSGAGATALVAGNSGVSKFDGASWTQLGVAKGLGSATVNNLTSSASVLASTAAGLSILNPDVKGWTNTSVGSVIDAFSSGTFTFIAVGANLDEYNGTGLAGSVSASTILLGSASVKSVFVDPFGDLIVGTDTGLAMQLAGSASWSPVPVSASITRISADLFGNVYAVAAGTTGLYIINVFSGTMSLALSGTGVLSVCVDGAGTIYAGTNNGLMISKDGGATWSTQLSGENITAVTTSAPLYSF
jgi:hypothetical protein